MYKRIFLIVLDSVGCGELPDADKYGDVGANTLGHIAENIEDFNLPNLFKLGLHKIIPVKNNTAPIGIYGKMMEQSAGKDTPSGHWEISGKILEKPFPVYPDGFPEDLLEEWKKATGMKGYLGNKAASGTEIIKELGEEHLKTGFPIVYTSADSVFQIAAHEEIIPVNKLYEICENTRKILTGDHNIGRVIARPFIGTPGNFTRTENRKDFAVTPPDGILTDSVKKSGRDVIAVGKINDIFNGKGITKSIHTGNNKEGIETTLELLNDNTINGLVFVNLVDFDMLYGHRRNVEGYYSALVDFDNALAEMLDKINSDDALFITADHGNDPTYKGTDHTREHVPILAYSPSFRQNVDIGIRKTFADLGQTIAEMLEATPVPDGTSFYDIIKK